ncbi:MAG: signal peptidase I [Acidimicrobiales bacterium]
MAVTAGSAEAGTSGPAAPALSAESVLVAARASSLITALDDRESALAGPEPVTAFLEAAPSTREAPGPLPGVPTISPAVSPDTTSTGTGLAQEPPNTKTARKLADKAAAKEPKPPTRMLLEWIGIIAGALLVALVIKALLLQAFVIPSRSMEPTLLIGDRVLVFRPSYRLADVDRGDVVVFKRPEQLRGGGEDADLIKRVVGLAGETVEGHDGAVYVNDVRLEEPWLPAGTLIRDFAPTTVPAGHLWVMGDNRDNSQDSRVFGTLDQDQVIGEAFVRWWPTSRFGGL